jgi:hypothetical protein
LIGKCKRFDFSFFLMFGCTCEKKKGTTKH